MGYGNGVTRRAAEIRLDALLRTACDVIVERGLANTRTADVAQAAGVSQALVFYHFATKDRLLAQAFAYAVEQDLARLDAVMRSSAPPLTKLRRIVRLYTPAGRATARRAGHPPPGRGSRVAVPHGPWCSPSP